MVKVISVEATDRQVEMYDLSMKKQPVYYCNGLVNHNSTKELATALTNKGLDTGVVNQKNQQMKLDKASLAKLDNEIADWLLLRKHYSTQLNTYIKKFIEIDQGFAQYKIFSTDCLTETAIVLSKRGYLSIKEVKKYDEIWTVKGWDQVVDFIPQGKDTVYKVTLTDGRELTGTYRHPVSVIVDDKPLLKRVIDLNPGDVVEECKTDFIPDLYFNPVKIDFNYDYSKHKQSAVTRIKNNNLVTIPDYLSLDLCRLMGAIAGDGSVKEDRVSVCFYENDVDIIDSYSLILESLHGKEIGTEISKSDHTVKKYLCSVILRDFYRFLEVKDDKLPEIIKQSGPLGVLAFFSGYFDTDGSKVVNKYSITSICKNRLKELHHCLSLIGYKLTHADLKGKNASELRMLLKTAVDRFHSENTMLCARKKPVYKKAKNIVKVKSVEKLPDKQEVYDITMDTEPLFIVNGFISHNTGRLSSGNDLKVKSRANYYFMPLNFQNLTKPKTGYYEAIESKAENNILGFVFLFITDNNDVFKEYKTNNPGKKFVEGFSPKMNIRNAIKAPDGYLISSIDFSGQELRILANACIPYSQELNTNIGKISMQGIKELMSKGEKVLVETPIGFKLITKFFDVGTKGLCTLTLSNGTKFVCSDMELFLVKDTKDSIVKFVRLKHLIKGRHLLIEPSDNIDPALIRQALSLID